MSSKDIDSTMVSDLLTMVNATPGHTQLYFNISDEQTNSHVLLRSSRQQIEVSKALVQYVDSNDSMSYKIN